MNLLFCWDGHAHRAGTNASTVIYWVKIDVNKSAKIGLIAFPIVFNLVIHNSVQSEQGI